MKQILGKIYKDFICVAVMLTAVIMIIYRLYDLQNMEWNIPLYYSGGDGMAYLVDARMLSESPWMMESERLAAPYGSNDNDFFASNLHSVDMLMLKGIVRVVHDPAVAVNLLFLALFPIIAVSMYLVLRSLSIKSWVAALGGLLYSLTPYIFMRGMGHFVLSAYYFIPLSILLCIWIYEDERFFRLDRQFHRYWKNWIAIVGAILIANNGIAYYPFFSCFFLLVTGISIVIKTKRWKQLSKSLVMVGMICFWVMISLIPSFLYIAKNGSNSNAVYRTVDGAEAFGLKIAQLILPVNSHGIPFLQNIIETYNENMPLVNENAMSYLGIVGVIGFVGLLAFLFVRNVREEKIWQSRLVLLSELNITAVLLGTVGGFSSIFCITVTSLIRCYNRISIFIEFFCILAVCLVINQISQKIIEKKYAHGIFSVLVCILGLFSIYEGYPNTYINYQQNKVSYISDKRFVERIESNMPEGSMIYQLPYHEYPESGPLNRMQDYDLFRGFIHSKTLKWSYGGTKGRESDKYNYSIYLMSYEEMIPVLKESGFRGVYIDLAAYEPDQIENLSTIFFQQTGNIPIISDDGRLCFYNLY